MAEIGRVLGRTAFTLLKKTNNLLFLGSGEKTAKRTIIAVAVSSGTQVCRPQYKDRQAQGRSCQTFQWAVFPQNITEKSSVRETKLHICLPIQERALVFICELEGRFSPLYLNFRSYASHLLEDIGRSSFQNQICKKSCYQTEHQFKKHTRPVHVDLSMTGEMNKDTEDCFYTSLASPHTQVRFLVKTTSSFGKQKNFLTPAVLAESHGSRAQQKRSLSTVMFIEREQSHCIFLQRSHGEVLSLVRAYMKNSSPDPPPYQSKTAYYDILQVPTNATHAQIKTAYYKQSFIYHPDKNSGSEEATMRFSEITEAYNVLGNKTLKRKYDRGILSKADVQGAGRPPAKETPSSSAASQPKRSRQSPSVDINGKSVFDFDEFYRSHYGDQLQREKDLRRRREEILKDRDNPNQEALTDVTVFLLFFFAIAVLLCM